MPIIDPDEEVKQTQIIDPDAERVPELRAETRTLPLQTQEKIMGYVRPALEFGGMAVGGVLGAPLEAIPTVGTAAHAALVGGGYATGKRIADIVGEKVFGIPGEPRTLKSEALAVPKDVLAGGTMELGGQVAGKVLGRVVSPFGKTMTEESRQIARLAEEKGIPLTPAEITKSMPLSLTENILSYIPGSSGIMQRGRIKQLQGLISSRENLFNELTAGRTTTRSLEQAGLDIKTAIDDVVSQTKLKTEAQSATLKNNILKSLGSNETYESLGSSAQRAMADHSAQIAKQGEALYNRAWELIGTDQKIPLPGLKERARELYRRELDKPPSLRNPGIMKVLSDVGDFRVGDVELQAFGPDIRKQIEAQIEMSGMTSHSPQSIQAMRSEINQRIISGDLAYQTQQMGGQRLLSSPEAGIYKQLRKALDKDLNTYFATPERQEAKQAWDVAQSFWKAGKQVFDKDAVRKAMRISPDKLIETVFRPNSPMAVNQVKTAVGEQAFQNLKQGFTNRIFDKVGQGGFMWEKLDMELARHGKETLSAIYSPAELNSLTKAVNEGLKTDKPKIDYFFRKILANSDANTIFNVTFRPNNSENIVAVKRVVDKDLFQDAKRILTEKMLGMNELGIYRPFKGAVNFSKFDEDTLKTIYDPEELKTLKDFVAISRRSEGAEIIAGNPSGTAKSLITFEAGKAVVKNPVTGSLFWILPNGLARIYLSPIARKYFTEGFRLPGTAREATSLATKILAVAGGDAVRREEIKQRQQASGVPERPPIQE